MLYRLSEVEALMNEGPGLHVRTSQGYAVDLERGSVDPVSGLELPGLAADPLDPEPWWTRDRREWIARQLRPHRGVEGVDREEFAWLLRGRIVGRGAENEPLLTDVDVVARVAECLLDEADQVYRESFPAYADSVGTGIDAPAHV